jgi:type II secretory pathway pseudopilin PulG
MMRRKDGFTLTGLIISVLLISILSAISIPLMSGPLRRQRLNNLVIELSGWLEEVSVRAEFAGAPCTVTITTGTLTPGLPKGFSRLPLQRLQSFGSVSGNRSFPCQKPFPQQVISLPI